MKLPVAFFAFLLLAVSVQASTPVSQPVWTNLPVHITFRDVNGLEVDPGPVQRVSSNPSCVDALPGPTNSDLILQSGASSCATTVTVTALGSGFQVFLDASVTPGSGTPVSATVTVGTPVPR